MAKTKAGEAEKSAAAKKEEDRAKRERSFNESRESPGQPTFKEMEEAGQDGRLSLDSVNPARRRQVQTRAMSEAEMEISKEVLNTPSDKRLSEEDVDALVKIRTVEKLQQWGWDIPSSGLPDTSEEEGGFWSGVGDFVLGIPRFIKDRASDVVGYGTGAYIPMSPHSENFRVRIGEQAKTFGFGELGRQTMIQQNRPKVPAPLPPVPPRAANPSGGRRRTGY